MSTIQEIIDRADANRPNAFSRMTKLKWISDLDGKIAADVFLMGIEEIRQLEYKGEEGLQKEPLVSYPHDDIYDLWLEAKIDAANGEYNRYQNSMQLYNESFGNFVRWFASVYEPAQTPYGNEFVPRKDVPAYYLTAYGIALKRGFSGTVDEWLASLSAYGVAVRNGFDGTEAEWLESIKGIKPHFAIGRVETLPSYVPAYVTIGGTDAMPVLNFGIPKSSDEDIDLKAYIDEQLRKMPSIKFTPDGSVPDDLEEGDILLSPDEE